MVDFVEHEDADALAEALAAETALHLSAAIAARGRASFAVPGGSTPRDYLAVLGRQALDWPRIAIMPTDERWTPPNDDRSNERMIRAALGLANPEFLAFWRGGEDPASAAPKIAKDFAPHLPLDLVVLGMGADMHCASLFPEGDGLAAAMAADAAETVAAITAPGAAEPRVTLTAPVLSGAAHLRLLITGAEKRAALDAALDANDPLAAPIGAVLRRAKDAVVHWAP